jgi:hypothetical protein
MEYDIDYLELKYNLINCFLINLHKNILDISYSIHDKNITIQVVLLTGYNLSPTSLEIIHEKLSDFKFEIKEIHLTKSEYNQSKGEWPPLNYKWLDYLLFSKAEVL